MDFKITGKHIDVTDAIRDYARQKTERLHRYYDRIQEISVVIDQHDRAFEVEVLVDVEHHEPFVGKHRGEDLYGCIDQTVDKLERQLTDFKDRLRKQRKRAL